VGSGEGSKVNEEQQAVTTYLPSGLKTALTTGPSWPRRTTGSPEPSAAHTRAVLSQEVVTTRPAVGAEGGAQHPELVAARRTTGSPEPSAGHTRAVLSQEAVTTRLPSGLKVALDTAA
jgi:hypothetical protein